MAAYTPYEPQWIATAGILSPTVQQIYPAEQAAWRTGDLLVSVTTGTITNPTNGAGTLAAVAGPSLGSTPTPFNVTSASYSVTQGVVAVTAAAASSHPARSLFCVVSYTTGAQTNESLNSVPFLINTVAGVQAKVNVTATGAPSTATSYSLYVGFAPNTYYSQAQNVTLGTPTSIAYPLTNSLGVNKASAGASTGILGLADCDSDAYFAGILGATAGGSQNTGKRSLFGATQSFGPGWTNDPLALPVIKLQTGLVEINLVQAWNAGLVAQNVGFNIDSTTGYFVADTTQTAAGVIQDIAYGPGYRGNVGDTYARIRVKLNASAVA